MCALLPHEYQAPSSGTVERIDSDPPDRLRQHDIKVLSSVIIPLESISPSLADTPLLQLAPGD